MDDLGAALPVTGREGDSISQRIENLDLGTIAASRLVFPRAVDLHGWAIVESTGAAVAKVRIRDGQGAAGEVVAPIALAASGTSIIYASGRGVRCASGLFLEVVAGSVEVVLYYRDR